jgi:DNA-binding CsgD family transcriptional regulator
MFSDPEAGRELLTRAGELAESNGLAEDACRAFHNIASVDCDHHRFDLAATEIEQALAVARRLEQPWFEADTLVLRALLDLATGDWARALATVEALDDLPGISEAPAVRVVATVELRRGGPQAQALVQRAWELAEPTGELQWTRPAAALRAEAAWLAGDHAGVDEATREVYATALEHGSEWDVAELAAWRRRAGLLDEPDDREWGAPYDRALALCDAGDEQPLLEALALLDDLGATATARLVRRRLSAMGASRIPRGPRPSTRAHPEGLSARQAEVLALLGEGLTNAEVARRLFLTPKTVEHHVGAILRKLGVNSRAEAVERVT